MGGVTLFDLFASFDFITVALSCKRLIKSILNKEHKSCRLILLLIHCLLPQLFSLLEVMLINQLLSCLLKHVTVCLFNKLLAHFLIKGDNVGSFPAMVNLAGHRLSLTTALKFKIICNVCLCLATPSILSAQLEKKKYRHMFFLHFHTADTYPSQGQEDRSRWSFVSSLTWCLLSAGEIFFWEILHPSKVNNTASYDDHKNNFVKGENAGMQGESTHQLEHVPNLPCCWTWITFCTTLAQILPLSA